MRLIQHYKGGLYIVLEMAKHTETGEYLMVYKDQKGMVYARPSSMMYDEIEYDGGKVPRFKNLADFRI